MTTPAGLKSAAAYAADREYQVQYRTAHRDSRNAYLRARYATRREEYAARDKQRRTLRPGLETFRSRLRRGWTTERLKQFIDIQHGCCAICGNGFQAKRREPQGDHDHDTNAPRGLLCGNCNLGLGHFSEDPAKLRNAIVYLGHWGARPCQ